LGLRKESLKALLRTNSVGVGLRARKIITVWGKGKQKVSTGQSELYQSSEELRIHYVRGKKSCVPSRFHSEVKEKRGDLHRQINTASH